MKKTFGLIFINTILVLIQSSFFQELFGETLTPNLIIAFAYALFFMDLDELGIQSIFMGGLLLDLFGFSIIGLSPLVLVAGLVLFRYVKRYLFRGWLTNIVTVLAAEIMYAFVVFGMSGNLLDSWRVALMTLIFSLIFYVLNQRFKTLFNVSGYRFNR